MLIFKGFFYFCSLNSKLNQKISWEEEIKKQLKEKDLKDHLAKADHTKSLLKERKPLHQKQLLNSN